MNSDVSPVQAASGLPAPAVWPAVSRDRTVVVAGEDNAAAHLRSLTVGHEVIVPVTKGKLDFGPWQRVFYGEWDGQRPKRVVIKAMGE